MNNKTADGLRSRLFDALDGLMDKKISAKEVESICYLSEQIIKTANVELDIMREVNKDKEAERHHLVTMKREEKAALALLKNTIEVCDENPPSL